MIDNPLFKENLDELNLMIDDLEVDNEEWKQIVKGMDILLKNTLIKKSSDMGIQVTEDQLWWLPEHLIEEVKLASLNELKFEHPP